MRQGEHLNWSLERLIVKVRIRGNMGTFGKRLVVQFGTHGTARRIEDEAG